MAVTGHHARLGTRLRAKLCRGHYFKRLNSTSFQGTTPHRPGRALLSASGSSLRSVTAEPKRLLRTLAHPLEHAQSRSVSGTCRMEVFSLSRSLPPHSPPTLFRLGSNDSSVLCRGVTPRRRTCGSCGLGLHPPTSRPIGRQVSPRSPGSRA